jgi:hypothetical protein
MTFDPNEYFERGGFCRWIGWHYFVCIHINWQYSTLSCTVLGWNFGYGWRESPEKIKQAEDELERKWPGITK